MSGAYYNEIDPFAAEWLRRLILFGHIAPGDVDERDIRDVTADDLRGYTQHHFFAGLGGWSYAARLAGWPDDRPLASGSCPCQPFSAAGRRGGADDERHLWPAQYHLVRECRFPVWVGEQVASKDGLAWLDLVSADMEGAGYTGGAVDICAAGVGSPNIRQRLYLAWVADTLLAGRPERRTGAGSGSLAGSSGLVGVADADDEGSQGRKLREFGRADQRALGPSGLAGGVDDTASARHLGAVEGPEGAARDEARLRLSGERCEVDGDGGAVLHPGPVNGQWRDADWLLCRNPAGEPSWRPVEPGTFPLAHGLPGRVGRLRAYGNALNAQVAATFLEALMETMA